ncbi:MAG TPA: FHA domain-containing protein [Vicinamibacteria bacterium]|nr:FHA domain-containing protein [Vicinamibacteria bacterium]
MRFVFGDFTLDQATRQLHRAGEERHLEPKAFELLELLLARRPQAVSKADIQEQLWPGTFVSESSLTGLMAQIRRVLADNRRRPRFIRTVHGFGYAFSGAASVGASGRVPKSRLAFRVVWDEQVIPLRPGENLLGRDEDVAVRIEAPGVSRHHARIVVTDDQATLEDLESKNGTYLRNKRLEAPAVLADGDTLRLGRELLVFRSSPRAASTLTEVAGLRRPT